MANLINVETDVLYTDVLSPVSGQRLSAEVPLNWLEDRYLIGWSPWLGFGHGNVIEAHCILIHRSAGKPDAQLFLRGPHKETNVMYDLCRADFFPAGHGRFIPKGDQVLISFLVANVSYVVVYGQANARIFSVKAG